MKPEFLQSLFLTLDSRARAQFDEAARWCLQRSMEICGMEEYPRLKGAAEGERAGGDDLCEVCGKDFYSHPLDWRVIGYGDVPFLNVLCDGRRVKL